MSEMGNGYAEPFRQLLEVSRRNVEQATEQTVLLRQLVESLREVEARHKDAADQTRDLIVSSTDSVKTGIVSEMRSNEGWWRKVGVIVVGITALNGASSLVRLIEAIFKH